MSKGRPKRILLPVALSMGAVIIAVFLAEIYLRLTETHIVLEKAGGLPFLCESDAEFLVTYTSRGRRLVPNAAVIIRNHRISGRDIVMETNSLGFRDEELPAVKGPDEIRILALGDSITWGSYLQAGEVYVERAEEYMRAALGGRTVEVINAGVGDIGLAEEMDILKEKGLSVEPDIVVVSFYLNDSRPPWGFAGELGGRGWLRRHSLLAETVYRKLVLNRWMKEQGEDRLGWASVMNTLDWEEDRNAFLKLAGMASYDWGAAWKDASWDSVGRELRRLKELAAGHDFTAVVVAFPAAFQVYATFVEDTPQRMLREKAEQLGLYYLDLLPLLRKYREGEKNLYYDWCHPTVKTNDFIGREIADFLVKLPSPETRN